jgi:hypothetical protein
MLVIRSEQMRTLEEARFLEWLRDHLTRFFPERCLKLGPDAVNRTIVNGLRRARSYGFREPADLCRFLDLMLAFDPEFDRHESFPWASELLHAPEITDPTARMDLLTAAAKAHLHAAQKEATI